MKYVSPIYEVEAIACEDIMYSANKMANMMGITMSGDKTTITEHVNIAITDENGSTENVDQNPETSTGTGVMISMNFGGLFN